MLLLYKIMAENICAICQEGMNECEHKLSCGHIFHSECIIQWFRHGPNSCPLCRDDERENKSRRPLNYFDTWARSSYLRRKARNKNAPKELKRLVKKLKKKEDKYKNARKTLSNFRKENKEHIKKYRYLRNYTWICQRQEIEARRLVGLFSDIHYPIPIINRTTRGNRMFPPNHVRSRNAGEL